MQLASLPHRHIRRVVFFFLLVVLTHVAICQPTVSVWLVSNGFHTSLGMPTADAPLLRKLLPGPRPDEILIGWGAKDFYQGRTNLWTLSKAIASSPSALHLVPVHGSILRRFSHSDIVRLEMPRLQFERLLLQLESAFSRDASGHFQLIGEGYYPDSRFYLGRDRFYFPNFCNTWLAAKLRRSGTPLFLLTTILPSDLIRQTARYGHRESRRSAPADAF